MLFLKRWGVKDQDQEAAASENDKIELPQEDESGEVNAGSVAGNCVVDFLGCCT